jgi:hypothetical protein
VIIPLAITFLFAVGTIWCHCAAVREARTASPVPNPQSPIKNLKSK